MNIAVVLALAASLTLPLFPARAEIKPDIASIWTLQAENDSVSTRKQSDRYYSNGLRVGWTSPAGFVPDLVSRLGRNLWGEGQQRVGIELSHQIYTPSQTRLATPNPRDRPYAGYLSANFSLLNDTDSHRSLLMLGLGVIGPSALGRQVQNSFHELIAQRKNHGWNSQISDTPAIQLLHERTWRLKLGSFAGLEADALPALAIGFGTVRDYAQIGVSFRIGQGLDSDFGAPRLRPGLSGGDAFVPTRPFAWYIFAGVDGQAVAYDALLQSHPFRTGPDVGSVWSVAEFQGGFAIVAYDVRLTFTYVARTLEFRNQASGLHQFGSAALSVRF